MNNKNIISALENFKKAYEDLVIAWSEIDSIDLNELESIKLYPFNESFDELNVSEWVFESIEEITKINKLTKEVLKTVNFEAMKEFCNKQMERQNNGEDSGQMIGFEYCGMHIINPFMTSCTRYNVNPIEYYALKFLESEFCTMFRI